MLNFIHKLLRDGADPTAIENGLSALVAAVTIAGANAIATDIGS